MDSTKKADEIFEGSSSDHASGQVVIRSKSGKRRGKRSKLSLKQFSESGVVRGRVKTGRMQRDIIPEEEFVDVQRGRSRSFVEKNVFFWVWIDFEGCGAER